MDPIEEQLIAAFQQANTAKVDEAIILLDSAFKQAVAAGVKRWIPSLGFTLAIYHWSAGCLEEARDSLSELLRHVPEDAQSWFTLGMLLEKLGDAVDANAAFDRCLQLAVERNNQWLLELLGDRGHTPKGEAPGG